MKRFIVSFSLLIALSVSGLVQAQDSTTPNQESQAPKPATNTGVYGRDIYVPDTPPPSEPESAARSFADDFLRNTKQHIGFSVGAFETYIPDTFTVFRLPASLETKGLM